MGIPGILSVVTIVLTVLGSHAVLRRDVKAELQTLQARIDRLDDRIYQLATGIRPLIQGAEHES